MCHDEVLDTDGTTPTDEERQKVIDIIRRGMQNRIVAIVNPEMARELTITPAEAELLEKYAVEIPHVEILPPDSNELKNIQMDGSALKINIQFKIKPSNPKEDESDGTREQLSPEMEALLNAKTEELNLTVRTLNLLQANGIETVRDLCRLKRTDWLKFRNGGKKSLTELDDFLTDHSLTWGMNV